VKPFFRKLHRWLGLAMALQIIAWMGSGLYFAIFPIEVIRGEHLTLPAEAPDASMLAELIPPAQAWQQAIRELPAPHRLKDISLQARDGSAWYRVAGSAGEQAFTRLVNGTDGRLAQRLDEQAVRALAESVLAVPATIDSVEWVEQVAPGGEIRGRQLPVWGVHFTDPEALSLYFDPWTGDVLARRTTRWRIFDFLWMLHIMDFDSRDDFNTPLLQWAAALGLLVSLSGVVFWAMTTRLFRRRRVTPA
jgi:uncharacterized iron-regulated membrane protein